MKYKIGHKFVCNYHIMFFGIDPCIDLYEGDIIEILEQNGFLLTLIVSRKDGKQLATSMNYNGFCIVTNKYFTKEVDVKKTGAFR